MTPPEKPAERLARLFLSMFSANELRSLLRYTFPDELSQQMPGETAPFATLAAAASEALLHRDDLDVLWPRLIQERPRRRAEIEAARKYIDEWLGDDPDGKGPIRVLFVLSCPPTQTNLDTNEELRKIRAALVAAPHRDRFTIEMITAATYDDLRDSLLRHSPHILHIACHGTDDAELILSDGHGGEERIDAPTFVDLLDVLRADLRLVILNACHSAAITHRLVPAIDLAIGMRGEVNDSGAIHFAAVFYGAVATGSTVEAGFRLGVNELRRRKAQIDTPELLPREGPQRQRRFVTP